MSSAKRIAVLHGPNLNRLGRRDVARYGHATLADVDSALHAWADENAVVVETFQANGEGDLIDWLQAHQDDLSAVVVNPAGLSTYGVSLKEAIEDTGLPVAVVHISRQTRADHQTDIYTEIADLYLSGAGAQGYVLAATALLALLRSTEADA